MIYFELPQWLSIKESTCNAEDTGNASLIPGGGQGNPLQYSYLENPMDRGAWQATVHGVTESDMTEATEQTQHMITHLQETWKIQNKVTYSSTISYNYFLHR